jgi:outer membrane protein TolC
LKSAGDARQARAGRDRARHEFEQARRDVQVDVREAYYNIQKAKIQIRGARAELDYREKELDITQQKERMNMVEPKETLAAENALWRSRGQLRRGSVLLPDFLGGP